MRLCGCLYRNPGQPASADARKRCAAYNADMCDSLSPPTGLEHNERNLTYLVNNHLPRLTTHGSRIPLMLAALNRDVTNINP